jgi:hypothetical protein
MDTKERRSAAQRYADARLKVWTAFGETMPADLEELRDRLMIAVHTGFYAAPLAPIVAPATDAEAADLLAAYPDEEPGMIVTDLETLGDDAAALPSER